MRISGEGTIHDRHSGEQLGPVFREKGQSASADRSPQIGRSLPILLPIKIPLPLLLLLARKTGHIEELTVKLDAVFGADREGRADGLIHDDNGRQQSLIRIEHEHALARCWSLPARTGAGQVENQEHGGAETAKSQNPNRRLRSIFARKRHGFSGLGVAPAEILSKHAKPSNIAFPRVRFCRFIANSLARGRPAFPTLRSEVGIRLGTGDNITSFQYPTVKRSTNTKPQYDHRFKRKR